MQWQVRDVPASAAVLGRRTGALHRAETTAAVAVAATQRQAAFWVLQSPHRNNEKISLYIMGTQSRHSMPDLWGQRSGGREGSGHWGDAWRQTKHGHYRWRAGRARPPHPAGSTRAPHDSSATTGASRPHRLTRRHHPGGSSSSSSCAHHAAPRSQAYTSPVGWLALS